MPGFTKSLQGKQVDVNNAHLLEKSKKVDLGKTHFTVASLVFL